MLKRVKGRERVIRGTGRERESESVEESQREKESH